MSTFWKGLQRLAQDQLFTHGYLARGTAMRIAQRRAASVVSEDAKPVSAQTTRRAAWPRLSAMR
jgi:hypothetical protein